MRTITDYVVITSSKGFENIEKLVKENIGLGWQPLGGVAVVNNTNISSDASSSVSSPIIYAQAMVLYQDN